jgi:hypothetical protein
MGKESKAKFRADLLSRLQACLMYPENHVCADCPERNPTMVSLLMPPPAAEKNKEKESKKKKDKSKLIGVYCCKKCINEHMFMGREVCEVKNIKSVEQCKSSRIILLSSESNQLLKSMHSASITSITVLVGTEDVVSAVEFSGNLVVNCIYESKLDPKQKDTLYNSTDSETQQNARSVFIRM